MSISEYYYSLRILFTAISKTSQEQEKHVKKVSLEKDFVDSYTENTGKTNSKRRNRIISSPRDEILQRSCFSVDSSLLFIFFLKSIYKLFMYVMEVIMLKLKLKVEHQKDHKNKAIILR